MMKRMLMLLAMAAIPVFAESVRPVFSYKGNLRKVVGSLGGVPVTMEFLIYDSGDGSGGKPVWSQKQPVLLDNDGNFSAEVGDAKLPAALGRIKGEAMITMKPEGSGEFPRQPLARLARATYALSASTAKTASSRSLQANSVYAKRVTAGSLIAKDYGGAEAKVALAPSEDMNLNGGSQPVTINGGITGARSVSTYGLAYATALKGITSTVDSRAGSVVLKYDTLVMIGDGDSVRTIPVPAGGKLEGLNADTTRILGYTTFGKEAE